MRPYTTVVGQAAAGITGTKGGLRPVTKVGVDVVVVPMPACCFTNKASCRACRWCPTLCGHPDGVLCGGTTHERGPSHIGGCLSQFGNEVTQGVLIGIKKWQQGRSRDVTGPGSSAQLSQSCMPSAHEAHSAGEFEPWLQLLATEPMEGCICGCLNGTNIEGGLTAVQVAD